MRDKQEKRVTWARVLLLIVAGCAMLPAQSGAAFERIKALDGQWKGKSGDGSPATTSFHTTAAGSAVLQMLGEGGQYEMPTVYHPDGERLMATHYCAAKNQPRMVLAPASAATSTLRFEFLDATNLASPEASHMIGVAIEFVDKDQIRQHWTSLDHGKQTVDIFDFVRSRN